MSTACKVNRSGGYWGSLAPLCAALLITAVLAGGVAAQESSKPDTSSKVVTSIRISPEGIVVEGVTGGDTDTLGIMEAKKRAMESHAKAMEQLEKLEKMHIVNYDDEGHDIVRFGEDIRIRRDKRIRGSVVAIGGSVVIEGDVIGDVVAVGGNVSMESGASVTGDAVSVGGSVDLKSGSSVRGDAVSVGGKIIERDGSFVAGDTVSVGFIPGFFFKSFHSPFAFMAMDITGFAVKMLLILLLAWAAAAIIPHRVQRMVDYAGSSIWISALVGFAAVIALPLVVILLIVTLIGIPLAIILPLAFAVASIVAYAAGAGLLGYRFGSRLVSKAPGELSLAQAVLLGVLIVGIVRLVGKLLGLTSPILWPLSAALGVAGVLAGLFIYLAGLGSLLITRFGSQPRAAAVPAAPAPTPQAPGPQAGGWPPAGGLGSGGSEPAGGPPPQA
jgi:hypothetical protein